MDAVTNLKLKAIEDFKIFLRRAENGHIDTYDHIMNIIAFLESYEYFDNPRKIYEFLMNDE